MDWSAGVFSSDLPLETVRMLNDAIAYIRSLADLRGRHADWAEAAVRSAASLPAQAALEQNVLDLVARDRNDLLAKINGIKKTGNAAGRGRVGKHVEYQGVAGALKKKKETI